MNYTTQKYSQLSKIISHALRHEPWLYELELDEEGWVLIDQLLSSLKDKNSIWKDLSKNDLEKMIELSTKRRHEIFENKVRALYGHSLPEKLKKESAEPPGFLYHGTVPEIIKEIKAQGLLPMKRQYVHLSADVETAKQVGLRKSPNPIILTIQAKNAYKNDVVFYQGNEFVWLADSVPPKFIVFE